MKDDLNSEKDRIKQFTERNIAIEKDICRRKVTVRGLERNLSDLRNAQQDTIAHIEELKEQQEELDE